MPNIPRLHKILSLITTTKKTNFWKIFVLLWTSFLLTLLTFLYDEYIYQPNLTEQKNPIEYI